MFFGVVSVWLSSEAEAFDLSIRPFPPVVVISYILMLPKHPYFLYYSRHLVLHRGVRLSLLSPLHPVYSTATPSPCLHSSVVLSFRIFPG